MKMKLVKVFKRISVAADIRSLKRFNVSTLQRFNVF